MHFDSFHVGSECQDATAYVKALENARSLFDYAETVGYHFNLLDIGGGFPGSENRKIKVEEVRKYVAGFKKILNYKFFHVDIIGSPHAAAKKLIISFSD